MQNLFICHITFHQSLTFYVMVTFLIRIVLKGQSRQHQKDFQFYHQQNAGAGTEQLQDCKICKYIFSLRKYFQEVDDK